MSIRRTVLHSAAAGSLLFGACAPERTIVKEPQAEAILVSLPAQVKSGDGTRENRYQVYPEISREMKGKAKGIGYWEVELPLTYSTDIGDVYFNIHLTLSQLKADARQATAKELDGLIEKTVRHHVEKKGHAVMREIRSNISAAIDSFAQKTGDLDKDVKRYLETGG